MDFQIFVILLLQFFTVVDVTSDEPPPLYPNVTVAEYGMEYINTLNKSREYVFIYNETNVNNFGNNLIYKIHLDGTVMKIKSNRGLVFSKNKADLMPCSPKYTESARINVESNATSSEPLLVVVKQRKGISTWQLPLLVQKTDSDPQPYNKTSRTLCSSNYYKSETTVDEIEDEYITVSISTGSKFPVIFKLSVNLEYDFYISIGEKRNLSISPSEPRFYGYNFPDRSESGSVLIQVESDTNTCMTLIVQNTTCPVVGLDQNTEIKGFWQTVSQLGGITIRRDIYPNGFFVVLVVEGDDTDCIGEVGTSDRKKNISLIITKNITKAEGLKAAAISVIIGMAFCGIYGISVITHNACIRRKLRQQLLNEPEPSLPPPEQLLTPSVIEEAGPSQWTSIEDDSSVDDDIDMLDDAYSDKDIIRTKKVLAVSDLARKEPKILRHKSRLYLYYLGTIAIFYALPVVQLVATYQNVLHMTGNQDLCYFNFLCSHPFFWFSDFNHVFSNFAYILLGLLFIFLTYVREQNDNEQEEEKKSFGIPQHYGLFYAMGTALMMEGVLSACYHVCPNHINFQFDTSFMYIISVLCMVKIYQARHPDVNARASVTFAVLALMIFLGMVGVLNGSYTFWVMFTIGHLVVCFLLSAQIYYMGRYKLDRNVFRRIVMGFKHDGRVSIWHALRPLYTDRLILLLIANSSNVSLAVYGNMHHDKDFATFLLSLLMLNLLMYTFFYIVMKLCYKEKILPQPLRYILLSFITWGFALYFFINKSVSWSSTPAQSRFHNRPCTILKFFDHHDIWHFLSALAMFFSFMVLLTLDDDLQDTHRSQIPVF